MGVVDFFFFYFGIWRNEGWENLWTFAFVVPHGVTSDMCLLTGEIVLFHVLSDVDTETFYHMACRGTHTTQRGGKNGLSFHQCHSPTTQDRVKIFASFFHNQPAKAVFPGCVHFS